MGGIVLPSPPGFLACTQTRAARVAMLDYYEAYPEGKALAVVPPSIRMPQHIAEKTLLLQLLERRQGQTAVEDLVRNIVKSAKRTCYDSSTRRITFVLLDQAAAAGWHAKVIGYRGAKLQLLCPAILEREDLPADTITNRPHSRGLLQYRLRVLANGVSAGTVQAILSSSVTCTVTSVTRGLPNATDTYDSNYFVVSFDTSNCPDQLKLVTHVSALGASFFIHHHQKFQRVPCFNCYSPFHSSAKCASHPGARLLHHHREYTRQSRTSNLFPELTFTYLDVAGRLKHV